MITKNRKIYTIIAVIIAIIIIIIVGAVFGGYTANVHSMFDYGVYDAVNKRLSKEFNYFNGASEVEIVSAHIRNIKAVRIECSAELEYIEVLIRKNGAIDRSLGAKFNVSTVEFGDVYTDIAGIPYYEEIELDAFFENRELLSFDRIKGNWLVLKIRSEYDGLLKIEFV